MSIFCKLIDLNNESDVEQKLLLPLITSNIPLGFGYLSSDFRTKTSIKKIKIDKGKKEKLYFPDYIIILQGLPFIIIEAKTPGEDLEEALREARLYALELNSSFPKDTNPCSKIIVSDGKRILSSSWDSIVLDFDINFDDIQTSNDQYSKFVKFYSKENISNEVDKVFKKLRGKIKFVKPTTLIGGRNVSSEELPENDFGSELTLEYRHFFNPTTEEDRTAIVKNAYIASRQREKHLEPINKIILAAKPPSIINAKDIQDTSNPKEIYSKFETKPKLENQILLLIGNVGSGKSTFIDYLREVALPEKAKKETIWISIDLNIAPLSKDTIYGWIQNSIIESFRKNQKDIDFDELEIQKKIYYTELNKTEKGPAAYHKKGSDEYNKIMANRLYELQNNLEITSKGYSRFLCEQGRKLLVIVLDNCDKRKKDDQLLMFEVAKWLKEEYKCLVFLPLRDTTYDNHKSEPPLDTVIKDLVFRIDPPMLAKVLYRRIEFAIPNNKKKLQYNLKNGISVTYTQLEQRIYLACILRSLFQSDKFFRALFHGIAGRNIRKGIEIFLDFCKSGHISEAEIFKMRTSGGEHVLSSHLITRVLLRGNHRYYNDESSRIKNLFASYAEEEIENDPFVRISILQWLRHRYRKQGPNRTPGYEKVNHLISDLLLLGHSEVRIIKDLGILVKAGCILTESQATEVEEILQDDNVLGAEIVANDDLICIAPAGFTHLELLNNIDYLASCSEDVYYSKPQIAQGIADRLTGKSGKGYLSLISNLDNANDMLSYLLTYKKEFISRPDIYMEDGTYENLVDIQHGLDMIENFRKTNKIIFDNNKLKKEFPEGSIVDASVLSIKPYGIFVGLGLYAVGMIHVSKIGGGIIGDKKFSEIEIGDVLRVEVISYNEKHSKFELEIAH